MCCCCICHCQGEEDKPYSCCGCLPIHCGLIAIGILTIIITLALFLEVFWTLLNEQIHWWYVIVAVVCLVPIVVATVFVIRFFTNDQKASRTKMWIAMILCIVSFTLLCIWNLCYFQWCYKYDRVYAGVDGLDTLNNQRSLSWSGTYSSGSFLISSGATSFALPLLMPAVKMDHQSQSITPVELETWHQTHSEVKKQPRKKRKRTRRSDLPSFHHER